MCIRDSPNASTDDEIWRAQDSSTTTGYTTDSIHTDLNTYGDAKAGDTKNHWPPTNLDGAPFQALKLSDIYTKGDGYDNSKDHGLNIAKPSDALDGGTLRAVGLNAYDNTQPAGGVAISGMSNIFNCAVTSAEAPGQVTDIPGITNWFGKGNFDVYPPTNSVSTTGEIVSLPFYYLILTFAGSQKAIWPKTSWDPNPSTQWEARDGPACASWIKDWYQNYMETEGSAKGTGPKGPYTTAEDCAKQNTAAKESYYWGMSASLFFEFTAKYDPTFEPEPASAESELASAEPEPEGPNYN